MQLTSATGRLQVAVSMQLKAKRYDLPTRTARPSSTRKTSSGLTADVDVE